MSQRSYVPERSPRMARFVFSSSSLPRSSSGVRQSPSESRPLVLPLSDEPIVLSSSSSSGSSDSSSDGEVQPVSPAPRRIKRRRGRGRSRDASVAPPSPPVRRSGVASRRRVPRSPQASSQEAQAGVPSSPRVGGEPESPGEGDEEDTADVIVPLDGVARVRAWMLTIFQGAKCLRGVQPEEEASSAQEEEGGPHPGQQPRSPRLPHHGQEDDPLPSQVGAHAPALDGDSAVPARALGGSVRALLRRPCCRGIIYHVFQVEKCPETGRLHVHLYFITKNPVRFSTVRDWFIGAAVFQRKGTHQQCKAYCVKDLTRVLGPWTDGEEPAGRGARTDLEACRLAVKEGKGARHCIELGVGYQAVKYTETILKYLEAPRDWLPEVYWFHGTTGDGKTYTALQEALAKVDGDRSKVWMSGKTLKWWQGYDAHPVVIIDDFRKDFCTFHELLRITDRYEYVIENKGGSRQMLARYIYITCPWHPSVLYENQSDSVKQLLRRLGCPRDSDVSPNIRLFGSVVSAPGVNFVAPPSPRRIV